MRLQIVDPSEMFCNTLKEFLPNTFEVDICLDGETAISQICSFRPDIIVLSAMLPGSDGLYILQTVQNAGLRPMVLLLIPFISDYLSVRAAELKVDSIMCQPCNIHAALSYIIDFQDKLLGASDPIQSSARSLLIDLGFRTNLCGYRYLISALCILQENPNQSLTKELYPAVAKLHNGSWQQIEHGIRLSIANAWENRSGDAWKRYFADDRVKPTNSVFLTRLAQCLQRKDA